MPRRLLALMVVMVAFAGSLPLAQQSERERTEALSRRASERLQALHDEADRLAREERSLLVDLRKLEVESDIREAELARARADVLSATAELAAIDEQVTALTAEAEAALPDVKARLVTLYKLGRGQYARLLLSASDVRQFGQAVRLVSALAEQDRQRLAGHERRLAELQAKRSAAEQHRGQLAQAQEAAAKARGAAERAIAAHTALVRDIDTRRDLNAQYAGELMAAQQRLQASIAGLASDSTTLPIAPFKGELPWPSSGVVRQHFGAAAGGRPPLRGLEIATGDDATARAVHDGTVAYADAFSGYGRLVIVDHGSQTFSLYGNLADISVTKGAHVERGATLGTAAQSGDETPVLYFELRIDGRVVDPLQWLAKR